MARMSPEHDAAYPIVACLVAPMYCEVAHPKLAEPEPNRRFADNKNPRPCGQISGDPPIHIRPFCSRQRRCSPQTPVGSSLIGTAIIAPRGLEATKFFAQNAKNQLTRD